MISERGHSLALRFRWRHSLGLASDGRIGAAVTETDDGDAVLDVIGRDGGRT